MQRSLLFPSSETEAHRCQLTNDVCSLISSLNKIWTSTSYGDAGGLDHIHGKISVCLKCQF